MALKWIVKNFEDLTAHELYAIIRLRNEVFVVEQNCVFLDTDNIDLHCRHLMGWENNLLKAYTRLVPPGTMYKEPSIGRVVTSSSARRTGMGRQLMIESLNRLHTIYGKVPVRIGAQLYLKDFYASFGFQPYGEIYLEDGIKHIEMLFDPSVS